jgi:Ca-activated chloride channel family protein
MRAAVWLVLGCLLSAPALAGTWSSLWRTPDQQGEALLAAGHPARAAAVFVSPRLKGYADLEAGHYRAAAKLLAPFKDPTSEYDRGNALAHSGHLHAALAAYDAALKQAPHDRDIRHNRNLLARMLKRHPPKSPPHGGHGKPGAHKGGGKSRKGGSGGRAEARRPGKGSRSSRGRSGGGASGTGRGKRGHSGSTGSAGGPSAREAGGRSSALHGGAQAGRNAEAAQTQPGSGTGLPKRSPGQARRDAALAAAIARNQAHRGRTGHAAAAAQAPARAGGKPSSGAHARRPLFGGGAYRPRRKPVNEKTLALQQWLRQIPNNPAGLLRRKFLIEYMMRHRRDNP